MVKIGIFLGLFYCFGALGMDEPQPFPLDTPLSPGIDFMGVTEQLKGHVRAFGDAAETVKILHSYYQLIKDNREFCDKYNKQFFREFTRLTMHQLHAVADTSCWFWEQQLKHKMKRYLVITDEETSIIENVRTNRSIIMTFCQRMKGVADK